MRGSLLIILFLSIQSLAAEPIDFNRDVRSILSENCYACHGPDPNERKADIRIDTREGATEFDTIVPSKPDDSELIARITSDRDRYLMPPPKSGKKKLSEQQIQTLNDWIKQGAPYAKHWAYVVPKKVTPPRTDLAPIDAFIQAKLLDEGLDFSPEADRTTLARRLSLDLTGLPPSWDEVQAFVNDSSENAYERYVDAQLAKPAFGEHWARMWLDLARYADSAGYADDPSRTIWAYRDYVIRSFNKNKPFDQFTIEQIAGDMLPNPTQEQLIATAFHRNTMTNNEGGTNDEEFRNAAVIDRVNTTMSVWMGTSMACAQCHTHKYDPITQTEYFQVFAILNNSADADRKDESPILEIGDDPKKKQLRHKLQRTKNRLTKLGKSKDFFISVAAELLKPSIERRLAKAQPTTTVPIMRELPTGVGRTTKLQIRGNYLQTGDTVTPGLPSAMHTLPKGVNMDRMGLARWLVADDNPLTARVLANRFWENLFGKGLVRSSEEFGSQGELPTHPKLLDWLAVELQHDLRWDMKAFLKELVMSRTYRQSSKVTDKLLAKDADNEWYARGARFRISAEMIRDQALAVSGLLSRKMYGPSVNPPQPDLNLKAAFGGTLDWQTSKGADVHRRGLYTEWRRTNPYPSMITFDAPSREACMIRRVRTNTPLQALVTLNDPCYIEAAQALARKLIQVDGDAAAKAAAGLRMCLQREATAEEAKRLAELYEEVRLDYLASPKDAETMATVPIGPLPKGADAVELAAWTVVGNVLLNLDEMFLKR